MTKIVGLTGGIGSGKTTVANFFSDLGVPVYIADDRAKAIMDQPDIIQRVQEIFDVNVLQADGKIDRKAVRELVFDNQDLLDKLNNIVHPSVKQDFQVWLEQNSSADFVIKESAILFEKELHKECDLVILVVAPQELRIQRVMNRDNTNVDNIRQIMNNQLKDVDKIPLSDYIIENIDLILAKEQVKCIINRIKNEKDTI